MRLTSSAFSDNAPIPVQYTCKGTGDNPPLAIQDVPESARALALCLHDPDAPAGDFVHWLIWNMPAGTTTIAENSVPPGSVQGTNSFKRTGYGAPCPPSGTHRYIFNLYALDTTIELNEATTRTDCMAALQGHVIDQTTLTGTVSSDT